MAHVADHLSVLALEQQYRSCTDVTTARHFQTIWLLAKGARDCRGRGHGLVCAALGGDPMGAIGSTLLSGTVRVLNR